MGALVFLVDLGDVAGLAEALGKLICNPELRASMGAAGKGKIRNYSLNRVLHEMAAIYNRYLGRDRKF
ncbi:MAG: glycosyltransferase family 4 protein [Clostridia bacterium]|nr:glycosyltransferase family 4 protein [Clostridia bacterium]